MYARYRSNNKNVVDARCVFVVILLKQSTYISLTISHRGMAEGSSEHSGSWL